MRFQAKHMITIVAAVLVVGAVVFTAMLPRAMERRIQGLREQDEWAAALQLQDRLVRIFPRSDASRNSVLAMATNLSIHDPELLVGNNFIFVQGNPTVGDPEVYADALIRQLLRIAPRQRMEMWEGNLYEDAAQLQRALGNTAEARETMSLAREVFSERSQFRDDAVRIALVEWFVSPAERYAAGSRLLEEFNSRSDGEVSEYELSRLLVTTADAAVELGQYDYARELYEEALDATERNVDAARELDGRDEKPEIHLDEQPGYTRSIAGLRMIEFLESAGPDDGATVTGRVTHAGTGLQDATVYVVPADDGSRISTVFIHETAVRGRTDGEGRFAIGPLPPGEYELVIGLQARDALELGRTRIPELGELGGGEIREVSVEFLDRINIVEPQGRTEQVAYAPFDLHATWTPVQRADHYSVDLLVMFLGPDGEITGWSSASMLDELERPEAQALVEGLDLWSHASWSSDADGLSPTAVLGAFSPGAVVGLWVVARDKSGAMITDSEGLIAQRGGNYPFLSFTMPEVLPVQVVSALQASLQRDYAEALRLWNTAALELTERLVTDGEAELAAGIHLALGRLYTRLQPPLADTELARHHYDQAHTIIASAGLDIPEDIAGEIRAAGSSS